MGPSSSEMNLPAKESRFGAAHAMKRLPARRRLPSRLICVFFGHGINGVAGIA